MRKLVIGANKYEYMIGNQHMKIYNRSLNTSKVVELFILRPDVNDFYRERDRNKNQYGMITPRHVATWIVDNNF